MIIRPVSNPAVVSVDRVSGGGRPTSNKEDTMLYLALLGDDETEAPPMGTPECEAMYAGYAQFGEVNADAIRGGEALEPAATSMTVRHGDGAEPLVTAGPFAETTEALGGFYVLDAATLDDAIELARQIPAASTGWVALRPMVMWQGPEGDAPPAGTRYMALMYGKESEADIPETPAWDEGAAEHGRFIEAAGGGVQAGGAVHPLDTTTTVRVRHGELLVTDGPFSEVAEVVGGFYVLTAPTPEAAVGLAGNVPVGAGGAVELRPVMEFE
jgi:hypothetical protein